MAYAAGKDTVFKLDNSGGTLQTLTAYVESLQAAVQKIALLETTTMGDSAKDFITGLKEGDFTISGPWEGATMDAHLGGLLGNSATSSFEIHPAGTGSGLPKYTGECWLESYDISSTVDGLVEYTAKFVCSGAVTRGTN